MLASAIVTGGFGFGPTAPLSLKKIKAQKNGLIRQAGFDIFYGFGALGGEPSFAGSRI